MPPLVCRGCTKRLPNCNAGVDIFGQEESSNSRRENSVKAGIELITGLAVLNSDGLPGRLCTECNEKLEGFLAFRTQLLTSVRVLLTSAESSPLDNHSQVTAPLGQGGTDGSNPLPEPDQEQRVNENELNNINVDEDVESEIDVCSGDDDEVLELDVQRKRDEIYDVESSGESDIQVCDYEPNGM